MILKLKTVILSILALTITALPVAVPATAFAVIQQASCSGNITNGVATGAGTATGGTVDCSTPSSSIQSIAGKIVNIFSIIVGVVAVIMIIYAGFRYITSGGDSGNVSSAKNALIYAIVGLVVVVAAQFIVHYVLSSANTAVS